MTRCLIASDIWVQSTLSSVFFFSFHKHPFFFFVPQGTARRKKKVVHKTATADDKKLQGSLKKLAVNNIAGIEEVSLSEKSEPPPPPFISPAPVSKRSKAAGGRGGLSSDIRVSAFSYVQIPSKKSRGSLTIKNLTFKTVHFVLFDLNSFNNLSSVALFLFVLSFCRTVLTHWTKNPHKKTKSEIEV